MANLTTNKNFLSPTGFQFTIDRQKYPNIEYFCTQVTLPTLNLAESPVPYRGVNMALPGDRLQFGDLAITFNVTENMENYIETFDWMHRCINSKEDQSEDATLIILTSHNNPNKKIKFTDVFPVALDGFDFSTQQAEVAYVQATATFAYTVMEFV